MSHPRALLNETIHAPVRFSMMASLFGANEVEFRFLRDQLEISDSSLSKQITTLEDAGYVSVRKGQVGRRPRTWIKLTAKGRKAYQNHVAALRAIVDLDS